MPNTRLIHCLSLLAFAIGSFAIAPVSDALGKNEYGSPSAKDEASVAMLMDVDNTPLATVVRIGPDLLLGAVDLDRTDLRKNAIAIIMAPTSAPGTERQSGSKGKDQVPLSVTVSLIEIDTKSNLVLLRAAPDKLDQFGLARVTISAESPSFADPLSLSLAEGESAVAALEGGTRFGVWPRERVRITGVAADSGGVVFNKCGELAGLVAAPGKDADNSLALIPPAGLLKFIKQQEISLEPGEDVCDVGEADGLDDLLGATRADANRLRQELVEKQDELAKLAKQLQAPSLASAQRQGLAAEADRLKASLADTKGGIEASEDLIAAIERYRSAFERDRLLAILALIVVLGAVAGTLFLATRTRRNIAGRDESTAIFKAKANEAQQRLAAKPWQDVVLKGETGVLKIKGNLLGEGLPGAVLGRSPSPQRAQVNFGPSDISNVHARFFVLNGQLQIEDLGSTHGTFVNGQRLEDSTPVLLRDRMTIRLASHSFEVRIK